MILKSLMSFTLCPSWSSAASCSGFASAFSCFDFAPNLIPAVFLPVSKNFCLALKGLGRCGVAMISAIALALHLSELGRALTVRTRIAGPSPGTTIM